MKKTALLVPSLFVLLAPATPQSRSTFPTPPEGQNHEPVEKSPVTMTRQVDFVKMQKEADDLASMAQTIPSDVATVRKGMLPKDVIDKLKQIEKLSKRLRGELNP